MSDIVTEISALMAVSLATVGTTDVTIGLLAVAGALVGLTFSFVRRIRR